MLEDLTKVCRLPRIQIATIVEEQEFNENWNN